MNDSSSDRISELVRLPAQWWAGEAEVVRAYFSRPRSKADDIRWLSLQAARELGTAARLVIDLPAMFEGIEATLDRHEFESNTRGIYEEARHYRLLADILEFLSDDKLDVQKMLRLSGTLKQRRGHPDLPAMSRDIEVTRSLRDRYGELAEAALSFFEGGGAAIFYAGSTLLDHPFQTYSQGEVERKIAAAMRIIFEDEMRHGPAHIPAAAGKLRSEADWAAAGEIIEQKARVHLRLRNETFGYPLSEERLDEIDRGVRIRPLPVDYFDISAVSPYSA